jgi:hypothetical protein
MNEKLIFVFSLLSAAACFVHVHFNKCMHICGEAEHAYALPESQHHHHRRRVVVVA